MEVSEKLEKFKEPLSYIKSSENKAFAEKVIETLPDYFFEIPASSTGKYHPAYSLGEGGLLRHTLSAIRIAIELFRLEMWGFKNEDRDLIIIALIAHDGWKSGLVQTQYSVTEHPLLSVKALSSNEVLMAMLPKEKTDFIFDCIKTHMGQWVEDYKTKEVVLEKPSNKHQRFVHFCDYLASRKCLIMDFDIPLSTN